MQPQYHTHNRNLEESITSQIRAINKRTHDVTFFSVVLGSSKSSSSNSPSRHNGRTSPSSSNTPSHHAHSGHAHHSSRHHTSRDSSSSSTAKKDPSLKLALSPSGGNGSSYNHSRRRLSSPPSFDPRFTSPLALCECGVPDCTSGGASSGSNHSSGPGSLQQLAISGLNCSSTDVRENTLRSGHSAIQTLYAANDVTYPESISINLCNAPDNSTMQCDCGHINCPMCNLMMNLELTDPNVLK